MSENGNQLLSIESCGDKGKDIQRKMIYRSTIHMSSAFALMNLMRRNQQYCDVLLLSDEGTEFLAHKIILAGCSSYFDGLFMGLEKSDKHNIMIKGVDNISLASLIEFAYTAEICINEKNVRIILSAATLLQFFEVRCVCFEFLKNELNPSNCFEIRKIAITHNCTKLASLADNYIRQNFLDVIKHDEFLQLTVQELGNLISDNNLTVPSEEDIFECVKHWIKSSPITRRDYLFELIEHVRLPLFSRKYFDDSQLARLKGHSNFQKLISETQEYFDSNANAKILSKNPKTKPRGTPKLIVTVVERRDKEEIGIEIFDFQEHRWIHKSGPKFVENGAAAVIIGHLVYILGGYNNSGELNTLEIYDIYSGEWYFGSPMIKTRSVHSVTAFNNYILAIGGAQDGSCEIYDSHADTWHTISIISDRSFTNSCVVKGIVYVIGGYCPRTNETLSGVDTYNPLTGEWKAVAPMTMKRSEPGVGVLNDIIYVVGGKLDNNSGPTLKNAEKYDPLTNKWTEIHPMLVHRYRPAVINFNGMLYVFGGDSNRKNNYSKISTMEIYSPRSDTWTILPYSIDAPYKILSASLADKIITEKMEQ